MWLALGIRGGVTPSELAGEVPRTDGCPGAADGLVEGGGFKVDTAVAESLPALAKALHHAGDVAGCLDVVMRLADGAIRLDQERGADDALSLIHI